MTDWLGRVPIQRLLVFSALAVLACAMPVHNDTWWHLRAGYDTLGGHNPFVDRFSWTVPGGFFWNHSWLAQVLFAILHAIGGLPLLTAGTATLVTVTWALVWRQCRGDDMERSLLLAIALTVSTVTWSVRPQVAIVLLPVVVALVARNRAWWVALTMAVWANLHAGFVLGILALASGVTASLVFDRRAVAARGRCALIGTACTLVTPLGLTNWREIVNSMARSEANAIIEWRPPSFDGAHLFFWATAAVLLVLLPIRWRRLDSAYVQVSAVCACLVLVSASRAVRNVPAFMLLAMPPISAMLWHASSARAPSNEAPRRSLLAPALVVSLSAAVVSALWTMSPTYLGWRPLSAGAIRAIAACRQPLFNTYSLGGPIIWFVPTQRVFVDSRQDPYPTDLVQAAARVEYQGIIRPLVDRYGIACAVLPPESPAVATLRSDGWHTRHAGTDAVVLERSPAN